MKAEQAFGTISWNLPGQISYTPYSFLFPSVTVFNRTGVERKYKLIFRVVSAQGVIIREYTPYDWFTVAPSSYVTLSPTFWVDRSGVALNVVLVEETAGEIAVLSCQFTTPLAQTISEIAEPVLGIGLLAVIAGLISELW